MGEEIIGAGKEAVIVCHRREVMQVTGRCKEDRLRPLACLINRVGETRLRIVRRGLKIAAAHSSSRPSASLVTYNTQAGMKTPAGFAQCVSSLGGCCSAQVPPAEVLVSLVVGVLPSTQFRRGRRW